MNGISKTASALGSKNANENQIVLKRIGILNALVLLGYLSCAVIICGPIIYLGIDHGFFVRGQDKVVYISDSMAMHPGFSIVGYATAYAFLWGAVMMMSWILQDISLFWTANFNLLMFNGTLAYIELNGPEHVVFIFGLTLSHLRVHHVISHSRLGFPLYREISLSSIVILITFYIAWFTSDVAHSTYDTHATTVTLEFLVWIFAGVEFMCMISIFHGSQYVSNAPDDILSKVHLEKGDPLLHRFPHPKWYIRSNQHEIKHRQHKQPVLQDHMGMYSHADEHNMHITPPLMHSHTPTLPPYKTALDVPFSAPLKQLVGDNPGIALNQSSADPYQSPW